MARGQNDKFARVFQEIDALKIEVAELKVKNEVSEKQLDAIGKKLDGISASLNQIIGKESVRAGIYGFIGSLITAIVAWIVTLIKGA